MLIPLICVVIVVQSLHHRLLDDNYVPLYEAGTWAQYFILWALYLLLISGACHFLKRLKFDYSSYFLNVIASLSFLALLPWGMKAPEIFFLATRAHFNIESRIIWEWVAIGPFLVGQIIILGWEHLKSTKYVIRYYALILLPYFFISLLTEDFVWISIFEKIFGWSQWEIAFEKYALEWPFICLAIAFLAGFLPVLAHLFLILKPLPPSPLRDALIQQSQRVNLHYRDLLIWDAGPGQVNAAVMGTLPFARYVLITEDMIERFSLNKIKLVFWHEMGHIVQRHLWIYFLFFVTVPGFFILSQHGSLALNPWEESLAILILWVMGFSALSRILEKHADLYAIKKTNQIQEYQDLLSQLGHAMGVSPRFFSLTHGSLASRIEFLNHITRNPREEQYFQKKIQFIFWTLFLIFLMEWSYWLIQFVVS